MKCPKCGHELSRKEAARAMGKVRSEAKAQAVRENGRKGGRPRKPLLPPFVPYDASIKPQP